jgi:proline iminopeptidase
MRTDHAPGGILVQLPDTQLYAVVRGEGYPLFVLHGVPGLDHHMFGDYLDPLANQFSLYFIDQRGQGRSTPASPNTLTLMQMSKDIILLAKALDIHDYAVLGHSYGALVALQNAVDFPAAASHTIISSGFPSARFLTHITENLGAFEPEYLRAAISASWAREATVVTESDVANLLHDQMPFHFANPLVPRIAEYETKTAESIYSPEVLRHFARQDYGDIEVEKFLPQVTQPTLVIAGRHDRTCSIAASQAIADGIPQSQMVICEESGHMTFVEENPKYLAEIRNFLLNT